MKTLIKEVYNRAIGFALIISMLFSSCAGFPALTQTTAQGSRAAAPSPASAPASAAQSPYYTGDGGRGTRLAVLIPEGRGLNSEQDYLPTLVQGVLVGDFNTYSAIDVLDRQSLEKVLVENESGIYTNEADYVQLGEIANVDYALTGNISRTGSNYAVQIQVVGTGHGQSQSTGGVTKASHSGSFTITELDDFTGIRKASLDLLTQMGVSLTAQARQELSSAGTSADVNGATSLAKGVVAERQGTEVTALNYYFQAAAYDPSLLEAANRSSILNANISSGNIGSDVRNDIQWRRDWVAKLTETEQFFENINRIGAMPYTLFYTTEINQGTVNYQTETVTLSIETHLHGSGAWTLPIERTLQAVYAGLEATGRKRDWGLASWPQRGVSSPNVFARRSSNFSIVFELLNDQNRVIGRQTLQAGGSWQLSGSGRPEINVNADDRNTVRFQNVNANDISDRMTIRVATVNGTAAETAARNGVLQIRSINQTQFDSNGRFRFERGEIRGFANDNARTATFINPGTIWGDPVISIGEGAFRSTQLISVTIGYGVTSIGNNAFSRNQLTSVTIPDSVTSIGNEAFANNRLTSVTIGNGVTSIGARAFHGSHLTRVVIPDSVRSIGSESFANNPLTSVLIGNGVTSIGEKTFYGNRLTSVVIPDSVRSIGESAFETPQYQGGGGERQYRITSITIGANVSMAQNSFRYSWRYYSDGNLYEGVNDSFVTYYNQNGKKAGSYTYVEGGVFSRGWVYDIPGNNTNLREAVDANRKADTIYWVVSGLAIAGLLAWIMLKPPSADRF